MLVRFDWLKRSFLIAILGVLVFSATAAALPTSQKTKPLYLDTTFYDPNGSGPSSCAAGGSGALDYAGRAIFNAAQLQKISENQPVYEEAATAVGIPWQMIAVIHKNEHGLERSNPPNGQGIYQFVDKHGGPYPTGPVDDAEFLRQTKLAAEFIKGKDLSKTLSATGSSADTIKDTFYGYNGRGYGGQAKSLGLSPDAEGSPYVMNKADELRDPAVNKTTWGQIKKDFGGIEYPANDFYGAYVMYAALNGGVCASTVSGPTRERIVAIATQELTAWQNKDLLPGNGFLKYSQNRKEDWCADFVSWVFNQAQVPLSSTKDGNVPAVQTIKDIGVKNGTFHAKDGYTPQPGDIVVRISSSESHVNIVVSNVHNNTFEVIGGNQSGGEGGFTKSLVTKYTTKLSDSAIVGYVSPQEKQEK